MTITPATVTTSISPMTPHSERVGTPEKSTNRGVPTRNAEGGEDNLPKVVLTGAERPGLGEQIGGLDFS